MRTTLDVTDEHRARLLELAARRGEKGFSKLVQEALDLYLGLAEQWDDKVRAATAVLGTLDDAAADRLETDSRALRASWR